MHRPRLKSVYSPISVGPDMICLGFPRTPGSATIPDPTGAITLVVELLDGTRTLQDIEHELATRVDGRDIRRLIHALEASGYLEDGAAEPPQELDRRERVRYSRNTEFFSYFSNAASPTAPPTRFAPQLSLRARRVVVLGVGGLGSHVALHLAALGVGELHLVDNDLVEESNLNRQLLFETADVGQQKVVVAARRIAALNPLIRVTTADQPVRSINDAVRLMTDCDLLVCAADRPRVDLDRWLNAAALRLRRPWMRGASVGLSVALDLFLPFESDCVECRLVSGGTDGTATRIVAALAQLGDELASPCISPVAGLLGAIAAWEALKFLTGITESPLTANQLVVDLPATQIHYFPTLPDPNCPACGAAAQEVA